MSARLAGTVFKMSVLLDTVTLSRLPSAVSRTTKLSVTDCTTPLALFAVVVVVALVVVTLAVAVGWVVGVRVAVGCV
jgi:hypothetical protein